MAKKRKNVKINLPFIFSCALILATFLIVTIFSGADWSRWLPSIGNIKHSFSEKLPETSDVSEVAHHTSDTSSS